MPAPARNDLHTEIAAAAARLIAEEGLDYAAAKRKAADEVMGDAGTRRTLPDNSVVEHELRRYLQTFDGDAHARRLAALRAQALSLMSWLSAFNPHLVGAVLNGTATEHSDIHLHLFTDSAKDVELFLLNEGIDFEVEAPRARDSAAAEELHFVVPARDPSLAPRLGVVLAVHDTDAIRVAARNRSSAPDLHPVEAAGRASADALRDLIHARQGAA
ncbi:MAG: hypothetical protein MUC68_02440 [Burkholderiaceae bacterium]|jgi:hypothetical protein|nr:hypothetical protein [Burkholderiaceae bacterium]